MASVSVEDSKNEGRFLRVLELFDPFILFYFISDKGIAVGLVILGISGLTGPIHSG